MKHSIIILTAQQKSSLLAFLNRVNLAGAEARTMAELQLRIEGAPERDVPEHPARQAATGAEGRGENGETEAAD